MAHLGSMLSKASSFESLDATRAQGQWQRFWSSNNEGARRKIKDKLRAQIAKLPVKDAGLAVSMGMHLAPILLSKLLLKELRADNVLPKQVAENKELLIKVCWPALLMHAMQPEDAQVCRASLHSAWVLCDIASTVAELPTHCRRDLSELLPYVRDLVAATRSGRRLFVKTSEEVVELRPSRRDMTFEGVLARHDHDEDDVVTSLYVHIHAVDFELQTSASGPSSSAAARAHGSGNAAQQAAERPRQDSGRNKAAGSKADEQCRGTGRGSPQQLENGAQSSSEYGDTQSDESQSDSEDEDTWQQMYMRPEDTFTRSGATNFLKLLRARDAEQKGLRRRIMTKAQIASAEGFEQSLCQACERHILTLPSEIFAGVPVMAKEYAKKPKGKICHPTLLDMLAYIPYLDVAVHKYHPRQIRFIRTDPSTMFKIVLCSVAERFKSRVPGYDAAVQWRIDEKKARAMQRGEQQGQKQKKEGPSGLRSRSEPSSQEGAQAPSASTSTSTRTPSKNSAPAAPSAPSLDDQKRKEAALRARREWVQSQIKEHAKERESIAQQISTLHKEDVRHQKMLEQLLQEERQLDLLFGRASTASAAASGAAATATPAASPCQPSSSPSPAAKRAEASTAGAAGASCPTVPSGGAGSQVAAAGATAETAAAAAAAQAAAVGDAAGTAAKGAAAGTAAVAAPMKQCFNCGEAGKSLKLCGRCQKVWLCSSECHAAAWPRHRAICKAPTHKGKTAKDSKQL